MRNALHRLSPSGSSEVGASGATLGSFTPHLCVELHVTQSAVTCSARKQQRRTAPSATFLATAKNEGDDNLFHEELKK